MLVLALMTLTLIQGHCGPAEVNSISYGIQTVHDGKLMHDINAHFRFDDLDSALDFENDC